MDHKREKLGMREAINELASFVSSLNLGSEENINEEYVQLVGEKIVNAHHNMAKLMDLAWGRENHLGFNLDKESM